MPITLDRHNDPHDAITFRNGVMALFIYPTNRGMPVERS